MKFLRPLLLTALSAAALAAAEDVPALQPYVLDHLSRVDSEADARFLIDAPAGKHGFVQSKNGHLYTEDGKRIKFWGVNIAGWTHGSTLIPPPKEAALFAQELAREGINAVRFQFLDLEKQQFHRPDVPDTTSPSGLIDGTQPTSQVFDQGQLDNLDHFCAELKANGIYIDFNLNVGRRYKAGDNVDDWDLIGNAKAITHFDPRLVELEKDYARQLLDHTNPYTHLKYSQDPAVAIVEIVNENSVLEFWQRNWFRGELAKGAPHHQLDITARMKTYLVGEYNKWLAKNRSAAQVAKLRKLAGVGANDLVPIMRRQDFDDAAKERFYTEGEFYVHLESDFMTGMESYLKKDLGVKALVLGTADHTYFISGYPQLRSTSKMDIVDQHVYWQHPAIYGKRNEPMVNFPLKSIEVKLTRSSMVGKPFTVSEVNEPFPTDYGSELIPLLASYGAFQDWDGIFIYTMESKLIGQWKGEIGDHFDITQDPVKMAQMPVGAMIFLRSDVRPAEKTIERTYSSDQIYESMRLPDSESPYYTPGFPLQLPLEHASRIKSLDSTPTKNFAEALPNPIVSDTGQLVWSTSEKNGGLVTIDSPRTTALVGFIRDNNGATSQMVPDIANKFAVITLSSLDGLPISRSNLLYLSTGGRAENTGMQWDERHANATVWGGPPTIIEPIKGWLLLKQIEGAVDMKVIPLDGSARQLKAEAGRRLESGWEIPIGTVPTTSYLIKVSR